MSAIFEAVELGKENRKLKKDLKACRAELRDLKICCQEALSDSWDRSDDGFKEMINGIDKVLQRKEGVDAETDKEFKDNPEAD